MQPTSQLGAVVKEIDVKPFYTLRIVPVGMISRAVREPVILQDLTALFEEFTKDLNEDPKAAALRQLGLLNSTPPPANLPGFRDPTRKVTAENIKGELGIFNRFSGSPSLGPSIRVCFVFTHGKPGQLAVDGDELPTAELVKAFYPGDSSRPYLGVLIVDACNSGTLEGGLSAPPPGTGTVWKSLYFGHRGLVTLSIALEGQRAIIFNGEPIFMRAFLNVFAEDKYPRAMFGVPNTELITWDLFASVLQREYRIHYEELLAPAFSSTPAEVSLAASMRPRPGKETRDQWAAAIMRGSWRPTNGVSNVKVDRFPPTSQKWPQRRERRSRVKSLRNN